MVRNHLSKPNQTFVLALTQEKCITWIENLLAIPAWIESEVVIESEASSNRKKKKKDLNSCFN